MAPKEQRPKAIAKTTAGFSTVRRGQADFVQYLSSQDEQMNNQRGVIDYDGSVLEPCSIKYIHTLCMELLRARSFKYVKITEVTSTKQQIARLEFLEYEFERLLKHQALFPSPDVKARFLALVSMDGSLSADTVCANLLIEKEWRRYDNIWREEHNRPSYLKGSHGWENFLLNGAPGLPGQRAETSPKSSFQALPITALRIIADYAREEAEILNFIRQSPSNFEIRRAPTALMVDFDNPHSPEERFPMTDNHHVGFSNFVGINPFRDWRQIEHDPSCSGADRVEGFSALAHRIDQLPLAANAPRAALQAPNLFVFTPLRTFHSPIDLSKVKYFQKDRRNGGVGIQSKSSLSIKHQMLRPLYKASIKVTEVVEVVDAEGEWIKLILDQVHIHAENRWLDSRTPVCDR